MSKSTSHRFWRSISRFGLLVVGVLAGVAIALYIGGASAAVRSGAAWLVYHLGWTGFVLVPLAIWTIFLGASIASGACRHGPRRRTALWGLEIVQELGPLVGLIGTVFYLGSAMNQVGEDVALLIRSVAPALYSTIGGLIVATAAFLLRKIETRPALGQGCRQPPPRTTTNKPPPTKTKEIHP